MNPPPEDDPADISHEKARQELYGHGSAGSTGTEAFNIVALIVAVVLGAIAVETIDHWSQWLVLAVIIATVAGIMIALSPSRRGY